MFQESLKNLFRQGNNVFLTVNIVTDDDSVVEYYNDLDRMFWGECGGMDVIDDWISESYEIQRVNRWLW